MTNEAIRLILDMGRSGKDVQEVRQELDRLKGSAEGAAAGAGELDEATAKLGKSSGNSAQAMLQLGRGIQDFSAAGILGITNNVEGLAQALGLGAGVAGTATAAAVAVQLLTPAIKGMIAGLGDGDIQAQASAAALEKLTEAGARLKEQLAELNALSDTRLAKIEAENAAMERRVRVEEARRAARKRALDQEAKEQAEAAAMEGAPGREEAIRRPSEEGRAGELRKIIGGDPEARLIRERVELAIQNDPRFRTTNRAGRHAERDRILGAFYAGHRDALDFVIENLRPAGGTPEGHMPQEGEAPLRGRLEQLTREAQMGRRARDIGGTLRGFGRRVREKTGAEAARRAKAAKEEADRERERRAARDEHAMDAYLERIGGDARRELAKDDRARKAARLRKDREAAGEAREHLPERQAAEVRRATGLALSPEAAHRLVGPREHPSAGDLDQARLARRIQGQVFEGTGRRIGGDRALDAARRLIEESNRAQVEAASAFAGALDGMGANTRVWQGMTRMIHRQMEQSPMPGGLPR